MRGREREEIKSNSGKIQKVTLKTDFSMCWKSTTEGKIAFKRFDIISLPPLERKEKTNIS